ncbi:hypothetical protein A3731_07780 [Roseovarius sp. HI0049]|nr:hypothetical protein A3731_32160 [Roseovarius sp. HI0049]KZY47622.1 hypothetical protein A3731_07780 [Roseovarius sp. HI0049]
MSRLGIYADKIEAIREQKGLTPSGFREDGTDAAGADKEAMEREMYRRADAHLPSGIGSPPEDESNTA